MEPVLYVGSLSRIECIRIPKHIDVERDLYIYIYISLYISVMHGRSYKPTSLSILGQFPGFLGKLADSQKSLPQ